MNARVNFLADAAPDAAGPAPAAPMVLVPQTAVVQRDGAEFVFVVKGGAAELRTVRRGDPKGDDVYVLDGLSAGERVVTTGADTLEDGDRVEAGS
jgi:hypothetical protein